jgi:site-specific DNA recombinase
MSKITGTAMIKASSQNKRKAAIYARVSSKEQEKEGFSIPAQLKLLTAYAVEKGFAVVQQYVDVETAKRAGRSGFTAMVEFFREQSKTRIPANPCRVLLVEKTDRLYRNLKDWVTLDELDLEIHFAKENVVFSHDSRSSEKFIHGIKVLMAKNYIDNLSEETKKGMLEKAEQGIYPSFAPLGYINVQCGDRRYIQPDPELAPVIRQLFEWYATGNHSLLDVARKANSEGLTYRKTGNKVGKSTVHKILTSPIYHGEFEWVGKHYRGIHEPIISRELFDRVQEVLTEKGHCRRRPHTHEWAFQGLVFCGHCGCALTAEIKKGRYVYYHCTGYKGKCPEKYVREEEMARQFGEALRLIQMDREVLEWVVTALKESHGDEKRYHDEMIAKLQKEYQKLQDRVDAMYVDKLDAKVPQEFFDRKNSDWRAEQAEILWKIEKHQNANCSYLEEGVGLLELGQKATSLYEKQEMREKRRVLDFIFSNCLWRDGSLIPNYRKPFDMLALTNVAYQKKKATSRVKSGLSEIWLPVVKAYRTVLLKPSLKSVAYWRV